MESKKSIAIVGTGIAGLTCAHLLSSEYKVTILESADTLGMDSASQTVDGARMDVPLRTFSRDYYPNLTALYESLGVQFSHANYEFACYKQKNSDKYFTYFNIYRNKLFQKLFGFDIISFPKVFSLNPLKMIKYFSYITEYYFFQRRGPTDLATGKCENKTFKEYVLENHSKNFYEELLLPMLSVICTCSWESVGNYPAEVIIDYLCGFSRQHPLGTSTLRATSGTIETVKKLSSNCHKVLTSCSVIKVETAENNNNKKPTITWQMKKEKNNNQVFTEQFDYVIIATQANAALNLVGNGENDEYLKSLGSIKYEKSRTMLHTDESIIPSNFDGTCSLSVSDDGTKSDCTIWMNRIDPILGQTLKRNVYQTWNPLKEPNTKPIVDVIFERPIMTLDSLNGLDLLQDINGKNGIWFVGAYSLYSMPLLENGVRSSIRVCNRLLKTPHKELGTQISGECFAKRRPDLVRSRSLTRKRSHASLALDGIVFSSTLAFVLGAASLFVLPFLTKSRREFSF